jgi:hypothetical protein
MKDENTPNEFASIISAEDQAKLLVSMSAARGEEGFTAEEAEKLIKWAQHYAIGWGMLQAAIDGLALINVGNADVDDRDDVTVVSSLTVLGPSGVFSHLMNLENAADAMSDMTEENTEDPIVPAGSGDEESRTPLE